MADTVIDQINNPDSSDLYGQDYINKRLEYLANGYHQLKVTPVTVGTLDAVKSDYINPTQTTMPDRADYAQTFYARELNEWEKRQNEPSDVDFNFSSYLVGLHKDFNPEEHRELIEYEAKLGLDVNLKDQEARQKIIDVKRRDDFLKTLNGRPLPDAFLSSPVVQSQTPTAKRALAQYASSMNVLNKVWTKDVEISPFSRGYELQTGLRDLRTKLADGEISDFDYIMEYNRLNTTYGDDGFWAGLASGVGSMGADFAGGYRITKDANEQMLDRYNNIASDMAKEEPSFFKSYFESVVDDARNDVVQGTIMGTVVNSAMAEAEAHQANKIAQIVASNPNVSLTDALDETESSKNTRAALFALINVGSALPIGTGVSTMGKGILKLGAKIPVIKVAPNAMSKVIAGSKGLLHNPVARVAKNKVVQQFATNTAKVLDKIALQATARLPTQLMATTAASAVENSVLMAAGEGISEYNYQEDANRLLEENKSQFFAAVDAAGEAFTQNLLAGIVMGLPHNFAAIGQMNYTIQKNSSINAKLSKQQDEIEKALDSGASPMAIKETAQLKYDRVFVNRDAVLDAISADPELLKELKQVAYDDKNHGQALAEAILIAMDERNDIAKLLNRAGSREAFIVDPVEVAAMVMHKPKLKELIAKHQKSKEGGLSEQELIDNYTKPLSEKVEELAQNENMFVKNFFTETLNGRSFDAELGAIEADINQKMSIPEGAGADFKSNELRNVARHFSLFLTNALDGFAKESGQSVTALYKSLNLRFVAGSRTYDVATGKVASKVGIEGNVIYLDDKMMASSLYHELSHLYLDLLKNSKATVHQTKLNNIAKRYALDKGIIKGNDSFDVTMLNEAQWQELQELYAYNATFQQAKEFFDHIEKSKEYYAYYEKFLQGDEEVLSALPDDPELAKAFVEAQKPRIERLDDEGYLRGDIDMITMIGMDLIRKFDKTQSYDDFMIEFAKEYKQLYNNDFIKFNFDLLKEYSFLNNNEKAALKVSELTNDVLNPSSINKTLMAQYLGKEVTDDFLESVTRLHNTIKRESLDAYRVYHDAFDTNDLNQLQNEVNDMLEKDIYLKRYEVMDAEYKDKINILSEQIKELQKDRNQISKLASKKKIDLSSYKEILAKVLSSEDMLSKAPSFLISDYLAKVDAKVSQLNDTLSKTRVSYDKNLSDIQRRKDVINSIAKLRANTIFKLDEQVKDMFELIHKHLHERKQTRSLTPISRAIVDRVENANAMFSLMGDLQIKFSKEQLLANGFSKEQVSALDKRGFVDAKNTMDLEDFYELFGDKKDPSTERAFKDLVRIVDDEVSFIKSEITNSLNRQFDSQLDSILNLRENYRDKSVELALNMVGRLGRDLYCKFHKQVNRSSMLRNIENQAKSLINAASTRVTSYQFERKGQYYIREGYKHLAVATNPDQIMLASKFFVSAEVCLTAARELHKVRKFIDTKRAKLKKKLERNHDTDAVSKSYDVDIFMRAKNMAYSMGIISSNRSFDDIKKFNTTTEELRRFDSNYVSSNQQFAEQNGVKYADLDVFATKNYDNMSYAEALENLELIDSRINIARELGKEQAQQRKQTIIDSIASFKDNLDAARSIYVKSEKNERDVADYEQKKGLKNSLDKLRHDIHMNTMRPTTILAMIDGALDEDNSKAYNAIYRPVIDAEQVCLSELSYMATNLTQPLMKAIDVLEKKGPKLEETYVINGVKEQRTESGEVKIKELQYVFGNNSSIYRQAVGILANMGTTSNRQAMCRSLGITEAKLTEVINDLTDKGIITNEMWHLVEQYIWRPYDAVYVKTAKAFNEVYGNYFTKENGIDIKLKDGTIIKGGYAPLTIMKGAEDADIVDPIKGDDYARMTLPSSDGFTKDRVIHDHEMSFEVLDIFRAMERQITFANMAKPCRTAWEIINTKEVKNAFEEILPDSIEVLSNGLRQAMSQSNMAVRSNMVKRLNGIVSRGNIAMLAYNLTNALMGASQLITATANVKTRDLAWAMVEFIGQRTIKKGMLRSDIDNVSTFMRNRNFLRNKRLDTVARHFEAKGILGKTTNFVFEFAYVLQSAVQNMCDYVVWVAAYHNQLKRNLVNGEVGNTKNGFDLKAVEEADRIVKRTQLSRSQGDLSEFETKDSIAAQVLVPFSSVFVSMINLSRTQYAFANKRFMNEAFKRRVYKAHTYMLVWIFPTLLTEMIRSGVAGEELYDTKEAAAVTVFSSMGYAIHPMVGAVLQMIGKTLANVFFEEKTYVPEGIYSSPLESLITRSFKGMAKIMEGEDADFKDWVDASSMVSFWLIGWPQFSNYLKFYSDLMDDEYFETTTLDKVRSLVTGKASPEQKGER